MTDDTVATFPADAACAGHDDPSLWDASVWGETAEHKEWRHNQAKAICRRCPVAFECAQTIDWTWDEGIRAGHLLPEKKNAARSAPPDIKHGTEAGYKQHARRHETACRECKEALSHARYARAQQKTLALCGTPTRSENQ